MKKAEVSTQVFLYVMIVVVMGAVLLLGYKFISSITRNSDQIALNDFKDNVAEKITGVKNNYGQVTVEEFNLNKKYSPVCFVNTESSPDLSNYPLIKSSVDTGSKENVFVMSNNNIVASLQTEPLIIAGNLLCINNTAGIIKLRMVSLGYAVNLSQGK